MSDQTSYQQERAKVRGQCFVSGVIVDQFDADCTKGDVARSLFVSTYTQPSPITVRPHRADTLIAVVLTAAEARFVTDGMVIHSEEPDWYLEGWIAESVSALYPAAALVRIYLETSQTAFVASGYIQCLPGSPAPRVRANPGNTKLFNWRTDLPPSAGHFDWRTPGQSSEAGAQLCQTAEACLAAARAHTRGLIEQDSTIAPALRLLEQEYISGASYLLGKIGT